MNKILVINPGSTSTKFAVFADLEIVFQETINHTAEELAQFGGIAEQFDFRKELILQRIKEENIEVNDFAAVIGRGGLVRPIPSGVYAVNEAMLHDLKNCIYPETHPCSLGGLIAHEIARTISNCIALIADPVVVDEMQDVAKISGLPQMPRRSLFHALNHKATARRYAKDTNKCYEELNLVVAHMGGGISIAAHRKGLVVDVNHTLDGYGPFSPERAGTLPNGELVKMCFSGKYSESEIKKMLVGKGGLFAHTGSTYASKIAAEGNEKDRNVVKAMAYNIAKEIGSMCAVLHGKVDAILLTGGIAHGEFVVSHIKEMVEAFAPVVVYAGENELQALAENAQRILQGEKPKVY